MKLATLRDGGSNGSPNGSRNGRLIVVSTDLDQACDAGDIAPNLLAALENWAVAAPRLHARYRALNDNQVSDAFAFDPRQAMAPLPRAPQWLDASAFLNHGRLMERAFNTPPIPDFDTVPVMYQGASDDLLGPHDDVPLPDEAQAIDFEGEFGVIVGDVPMACSALDAPSHLRLLVQINDWSLRALGPREMKTGFGFLQAKPSTSFAPIALTPDELGSAWQDGRVCLSLHVDWNGQWFGHPNGREMNFSFFQLIEHAARTRRLRAGTIIGSGTVSNHHGGAGSACISERRVIEMIEQGAAQTPFMRFGDRVQMAARDSLGNTPFGVIDQRVVHAAAGQPA